MKQNKILVLAHLTGKASTDAIYEKVVSTECELRGFAVVGGYKSRTSSVGRATLEIWLSKAQWGFR